MRELKPQQLETPSPPVEGVPYRIYTVLTDIGIQFTTPGVGAASSVKEAIATGELIRCRASEHACGADDIDHRSTKPKHP